MAHAPATAPSRFAMPPLACDCHMHVFGGPSDFPLPERRSYSPRAAPLAAWRRMAGETGLQRVVVVQPSVYGADNSCILQALRDIGPAGRGIAQIGAATPDDTLAELHAAGIRGVRLNPKSIGMGDKDALRTLILETGRRIAPFGWHLQIYAGIDMMAEAAKTILQSPVPVVLDHMGGARSDTTPQQLRPVLDLLATGRIWVKLSGAYRVSRADTGFHDATPIARLLVRANPERLVWGSDWPHTASHASKPMRDAPQIEFRSLDPTELLQRLADAAGDDATYTRILAKNPAELYAF